MHAAVAEFTDRSTGGDWQQRRRCCASEYCYTWGRGCHGCTTLLVCSEPLGSRWVIALDIIRKLSLESGLHHTHIAGVQQALAELWTARLVWSPACPSCGQRTAVVGESCVLPCNSSRLWLLGAKAPVRL